MNKYIVISIGFLLLLFGLALYKQRKLNKEYANMYEEFIKSDKYKVKGQF